MYLDANFWAGSSRGLGWDSLYLPWFVGKLSYFVIDSQKCFMQNQRVSSARDVATKPVMDD